ncbi:MAG: hypothetical protein FRX48_04341 [Lasallia pustulata]|uniref:Uncharacterized protein n=1 Tax=Lasallia pustulata TaxID=136370 RepID=A0A5M8PRN1_9LECA|nr:MAG: hypothetical protein FRX48_04341 [Lasallia pustulata]
MAEDVPLVNRPASTNNTNNSQATGRASPSLLRHRTLQKPSIVADTTIALGRRRSSLFSTDSMDEARQSLRSSTDDLLLPRVKASGLETHNEPSHWHSIPLALALLPAVGGLLFTNGSQVVTDVTLLVLAAIFLNWSVRLPWDWYCSAQSIRLRDAQASDDFYPGNDDTIIEEASEGDEIKHESPSPNSENKGPNKDRLRTDKTEHQLEAAAELKNHELLALFSCFTFPLVGAWLLHAIRGQLSRPSEGLVSNYNLTIFLLASELRPVSHLVKMVQSRTIYLQRVVSNNPYRESPPTPPISKAIIDDLTKRLDELEFHIAEASASKSPTQNGSATTNHLTTEVRKTLQPDLDALNRAVRRYEKRATLLALQTESRLQDLEARMSDAITLAAAAERSNSSSRHGPAMALLNAMSMAVLLPFQTAWTVFSLPARFAGKAIEVAEGFVEGRVKRELRTARGWGDAWASGWVEAAE